MSLTELQVSLEIASAWKAIPWFAYLMLALLLIEFLFSGIDDDDDQGGGKMIPVLQATQN